MRRRERVAGAGPPQSRLDLRRFTARDRLKSIAQLLPLPPAFPPIPPRRWLSGSLPQAALQAVRQRAPAWQQEQQQQQQGPVVLWYGDLLTSPTRQLQPWDGTRRRSPTAAAAPEAGDRAAPSAVPGMQQQAPPGGCNSTPGLSPSHPAGLRAEQLQLPPPQAKPQATACQLAAQVGEQQGLSPQTDSTPHDQASARGSPKAAATRHAGGGKARRRGKRAVQRRQRLVQAPLAYLPLVLLPLLLYAGCGAGQASASPAAAHGWGSACSWGGAALLLAAQAAHAWAGWWLGAALDTLYLLLLTGGCGRGATRPPAGTAGGGPACCACVATCVWAAVLAWSSGGQWHAHDAGMADMTVTARVICHLLQRSLDNQPASPPPCHAACCSSLAGTLSLTTALVASRLLTAAAKFAHASHTTNARRQHGSPVHASCRQLSKAALRRG